jgi:hypothetical protein
MHSPLNDLTGRLLIKFPGISLENARAEAKNLWAMPAFRISSIWLTAANRSNTRLNPFVSEFFAQSILRRLGIRTAEKTLICGAAEARDLPADFVVKFEEPAQSLNWRPDALPTGWCFASELVAGAATLDYVERKILKSRSGNKPADKFYAGFKPTLAEIERIKSAMDLHGLQYLSIAAFRVFLGCGCTPHFGNILVNKSGELISIDHAHIFVQTGEDLRKLFGFVGHDQKLLQVLGSVAGLSENGIRESVDEIPNHPACGSISGLTEYFCKRLRLWKQLLAGEQ